MGKPRHPGEGVRGRPWGLCWAPAAHPMYVGWRECARSVLNTRTIAARESHLWQSRQVVGSLLTLVTSPGAPGPGRVQACRAVGASCFLGATSESPTRSLRNLGQGEILISKGISWAIEMASLFFLS